MDYSAAIKFLYDLQLFGSKLGLENTFKLAALAGNPQNRLRFIHVAGTNGKGSTSAMLESTYRTAGFRVGLFTSPHLVSFGERIQVNRQPIGETEIARLVAVMRDLMAEFPANAHPTFFEVVTVMALRYFEEQRCDLVVWETGLGGRLDATNIVTPLASVITNIQFDHQQWLGHTLEEIAFEKAGIIKLGVPVVTAVDEPKAFQILFETAREKKAPFSVVGQTQTETGFWCDLQLPLLGEHQRRNAAVAVATVKAVMDKIPVDDDTIRSGLLRVQWPGRLQIVEHDAGRKLLLDGAHNVGSVEALLVALQTTFSNQAPALILGMFQDKDWESMCRILAPLAVRILLVPVNSPRSATTRELAAICQVANPAAIITECASLAEALEKTRDESFVVVTGSLYLVGEAMELLKLSPAIVTCERALNEWNIPASAPALPR